MTEDNNNSVPSPEVNIGFGYDFTSSSLDRDTFKARIFEIPDNEIIFSTRSNENSSILTGSSLDKITEDASASFGMNVSGFKPFALDIKAKFAMHATEKKNYKFAYVYHIFEKCTETFADCSVPRIRKLLVPECREWLNDPRIPPQNVVDSFGTHVIASGVVHGARFNGYMTFTDTEEKFNENFSADIVMNILKTRASLGTKYSDGEESLSSTMQCEFSQRGGLLSSEPVHEPLKEEAFWKDQILKDGMSNDIISIKNFHGIWELVDDDNMERALELKQYVSNMRKDFFLGGGHKILALSLMNKPSDVGPYGLDYRAANDIARRKFEVEFARDGNLQDFEVEAFYDYYSYHGQTASNNIGKVILPNGVEASQYFTSPEVGQFFFVAYTTGEVTEQKLIPRVYVFDLTPEEAERCKRYEKPHRMGEPGTI